MEGKGCRYEDINRIYEMSSVVKWIIVEIKFSRMMISRSDFYFKSVFFNRVYIDLMVIFIIGGGLGKDLILIKCCFLMDLIVRLK